MKIRIYKGLANGEITVPPSKSMAHRLLICAALSEEESVIKNLPSCDDVVATCECLRALGASITQIGDEYRIRGINVKKRDTGASIYANESGSTLRFLIPILLLLGAKYNVFAESALLKRPLTVYENLFGKSIKKEHGYVSVFGALKSGEYHIPANISSQFISGMLFALPLCEGDSRIILDTKIESRSYINLTLSALSDFGVKAYFEDERTIFIKGSQKYQGRRISVEGDYSAGAFIEALNLFSGKVRALGLREDSLQGDRVYREVFNALKKGKTTIDISDCPDNAPIFFALAAAFNGAEFLGTCRLKIKESDRAEAMKKELSKLGARLEILDDSVIVHKTELHAPSETIDSHNDHRIAMAMAVLLTKFGGEISECEVVKKSYPDFWQDLSSLGIKVEYL